MPARSRLTQLSLGTGLTALLACLACTGKPQQPAPTAGANGPPAPALAGRTLDGEPFDLTGYRGQVVLLNIWATWCEPCRAEMPELQALHTRHRDQGFTVIGVSVDAARLAPEVRRMVEEFGLTYPTVHDASNTVGPGFKVVGYPTSFLIDRTGAIVWRLDGLLNPGDPSLSAALTAALAG